MAIREESPSSKKERQACVISLLWTFAVRLFVRQRLPGIQLRLPRQIESEENTDGDSEDTGGTRDTQYYARAQTMMK
jgi:hypothetical protein